MNYDVAGNLIALQRYRENATLIDNLTYSNATTSNWLNSVTDAIAPTPETWDAETGSFTYDANGNLKTAPAPYSITAVTYDPTNLPVSITRSGTTTTYRYDAAGQRITKQVGTGNTEVYVLDGATTLGVFTVNSGGAPTSWYFNLHAGDRVVGRQPSTGSRSYYHSDMLGSTRAVVQGATVVESYDFEPWGLLMPGRTLGSGTKEGFGGKEQDSETGLDYFGARYYLPALGRWAGVDPAVDGMPAWSPYNYAYDNPVLHTDRDGRQVPETRVGEATMLGVFGVSSDPCKRGAGGPCSSAVLKEMARRAPATNQFVVNFAVQSVVGAATGLVLGKVLQGLGKALTAGRVVGAVDKLVPNATRGTNLAAHEAAGGHLLARHVGQTGAELAARLGAQPGISAASTFVSVAEAEAGVSAVIGARAGQLSSWVAAGAPGRLVLEAPFAGGQVLLRGATAPVAGTDLRLVLEGTSGGAWRIVTGYPLP